MASSETPKKVLVTEEVRNPLTKNINTISICRIEEEKIKKNNKSINENITKHSDCNTKKPSILIGENNEAIEEPLRIINKEPLEEGGKMIEPHEPQPVSHYLKHKINKELIEGLVENHWLNDSLLAMKLGKMECEAYHSLPKEPMRKAAIRNTKVLS
ncbi:hypothetical protein Tco_0542987 [Tanacetum coccineum]